MRTRRYDLSTPGRRWQDCAAGTGIARVCGLASLDRVDGRCGPSGRGQMWTEWARADVDRVGEGRCGPSGRGQMWTEWTRADVDRVDEGRCGPSHRLYGVVGTGSNRRVVRLQIGTKLGSVVDLTRLGPQETIHEALHAWRLHQVGAAQIMSLELLRPALVDRAATDHRPCCRP